MGYIDTSEKLPIFYNVVDAVGKNCPNKQEDVMLVQYLLDWYYKNYQPRAAVPEGVMKVDGIFDDVTSNWILQFQLNFMLSGYPIQADSRIDRIRDKKSFYHSSSNTVYSLAWLNWIVSSEEPEAFAKTTRFIPLQNSLSVPPSNNIVVSEPLQMTTAVAGL